MVRTKEERRNLVEQYKSSGQTQRAFAENNGVKLKTFCKWLSVAKKSGKKNQAASSFVEIKCENTQGRQNLTIRKGEIKIELSSFDEVVFQRILSTEKVKFYILTALQNC